MKTTFAKKEGFERKWYLIDANEVTLGHLATKLANLLRGKTKAIYSPHVDCGDHVIVINVEKVKLTGNKETQKEYYSHSRYPGGFKATPIAKVRKEKPADIIKKAVSGMIPRNKLHKPIMAKLKLFIGENHDHEAQKPVKIEL
jgi:large subunit ribosomal protein L13